MMSDPEAQTSRRGILGATGLFALGFASVALLLHLAFPNPLSLHADQRSEKLAMLDGLHGSVFSAAFGTSRVHNGFDPRAFDNALAAAPVPIKTRTVNLGLEGGSQAEQRAMALEFVRHLAPPTHGEACLLLLELNAGANFQKQYIVHPRSINVYDLSTERFISRLIDPRMALLQRAGRIGYAVAAVSMHYSNVGMLSNRIFAPPISAIDLARETQDDQRGLLIEPYSSKDEPSIRRAIESHPLYPAAESAFLTPGNAELIRDIAAASPLRELAFAYFIYPKTDDLQRVPEYPDHLTVDGCNIPILNLARPDRYPAFYQMGLWHDVGHLNAEGAALVSRQLALDLKSWYASHGLSAACHPAPGRS